MERSHHQDFLDLYDTYSDSIYRFILFKVSNTDIAWDLTQDCFLRMWEYASQAEKRVVQPKALLFTIARNLVIDHWRARARNRTVFFDTEVMDTNMDDGENAHDQLISLEETKQVMKLLEHLPDGDRELLTLRFTEELSFGDIAKIMGKNPVAVRVQAHRALRKLKSMIKI